MSWQLAGSWTHSSNVSEVDFTGLAGAEDILVVVVGVVCGTSSNLGVRVSTNNGGTWYDTSGDYVTLNNAGTPSNASAFRLWAANSTAARSAHTLIRAASLAGVPKFDHIVESNRRHLFTESLATINAVRVVPLIGGVLTAGTMYCMVRDRTPRTWELAGLWDHSVHGTLPAVPFTGLAGAEELIVMAQNVTRADASNMVVQVSTDNGSTWYDSSGDYVSINDNGVASNATGYRLFNGSGSPVSGVSWILAAGLNGAPKPDLLGETGLSATGRRHQFTASLAPINAVRVVTTSGADITGGAMRCLALR